MPNRHYSIRLKLFSRLVIIIYLFFGSENQEYGAGPVLEARFT